MGKGVYKYYKQRLIEIGGSNKCLYLKKVARKSSYDVGRILEGRDLKVAEFVEFLWSKHSCYFTLISNKDKNEILRNLDVQTKVFKKSDENSPLSFEEAEKLAKMREKEKKNADARAIDTEIAMLKELKREVEEIERETGRNELYMGYPFVFGMLSQGFQKMPIKAPLLLFPVKIEIPDENTVRIAFNDTAKIHINPALVFAYSQAKRVNVQDLELELDDMSSFKNVQSVLDYLESANVKIEFSPARNIFCYSKFKEPQEKELSVRNAAVIGRFSLSNSIYNDYTLLEKKKLTNDAIEELLLTAKGKVTQIKHKKAAISASKNNYTVKMLDFAQFDVVRKADEKGNMVIYGPPGTGKSQTIVNVITDAICKGKRVLVVSQKKAALDVVFNRLATLNEKAIYVSDEYKEKRDFYFRALSSHNTALDTARLDASIYESEYNSLQAKINEEEKKLELISKTLNDKRPFGLSLSEMYSSSYNFSKNSAEYEIYQKMLENKELMSFNYSEIKEAVFDTSENELAKTYYDFEERKNKNRLIGCMFSELDICTVGVAKGELEQLMKGAKRRSFNLNEYPMYSKALAYYGEVDDPKKIDKIIKAEASGIFQGKKRAQIKEEFMRTLKAIDEYVEDYVFLNTVFKREGFVSIVDNLVRGNYSYLKSAVEALSNYTTERDTNNLITNLPHYTRATLDFAYKNAKSYQGFLDIIEKIPILRIYYEVIYFEEHCKDALALIVDFPNITSRIYKLKERQLDIATKLTSIKCSKFYRDFYESAKSSKKPKIAGGAKDYLYQISKTQKFWPIRKVTETFGDYLFKLFPCWLLSPENVSNLLPLEKNLFDIVLFDEASQVFIESTLPTIYRGKNIVVAGDAKQLRPSSTFMKRYLGADPELEDDLSLQAALEVESLLDLAISRYTSANLTYHYRSRHSELIDFSNSAFYGSTLQVSPNISKNKKLRPIERYKVSGKWIDRTNPVEAKQVVDIIRDIFKTRKQNESIGVITFNSDQQACISDFIDKECAKDADFRASMQKERQRIENGEDTSIFVKNLENVQGDERDIIIFSIAYAKNSDGKVYTNFGSLSAEGGENRLNVAITRAKTRIIVVTSIEPEELKVESSKNRGPKLLRSYLSYVRSVANGDEGETKAILNELHPMEEASMQKITHLDSVAIQISDKLTKLGYKVELDVGNSKNKLSLAVYDEKLDKYAVGVILDTDAYAHSSSAMERDVYNPRFLEGRGWTLLRIWCRDWWLSPQKVIRQIVGLAEGAKAK